MVVRSTACLQPRPTCPLHMTFRYIAIEGPIGVGKTSLAERLATRLDATAVLEDTDNPFLDDFYDGPAGRRAAGAAVLPAEPPSPAARAPADGPVRAGDGLRLPVRQGQDLRVSESRRQRAVHLPAPLRAAREGRPAARPRDLPAGADRRADPADARPRRSRRAHAAPEPSASYLRELNEAYQHFFFHYTATPLLVVDTSHVDFSGERPGTRGSHSPDPHDGTRDDVLRAANVRRSRLRPPTSGPPAAPTSYLPTSYLHLAAVLKSGQMPWFKKTRTPIASSTTEKPSRVPEGLWVKCPGCAQLIYNKDLEQNLQVCPKCAHHLRITAADRLKALFDEGEFTEHFPDLLSNDPLQFTDTKPYRDRLQKTIADHRPQGRRGRGDGPARRHSGRRLPPWSTRSSAAAWAWSSARRSRARIEMALERRQPAIIVLVLGRRADDGGRPLADADGEGVGGARPARSRAAALHLGADRSDDRRRDGELRHARRPEHRRAEGAHRLRRPARHRADDPPEASGRIPAQRVPGRARHARPRRGSPRHEGHHRARAALHARRARDGRTPSTGAGGAWPPPRSTAHADLLDRLFALETFGIKLGLENISRLCARARPSRAPLRDAARRRHERQGLGGRDGRTPRSSRRGSRAARYTSPHLTDITERFVIGDTPVSAAALEAAASRVLDCADRLQRRGELRVPPTFFEATTATAFELFREAGVEVAVIEVGLGGRFDATNVIAPARRRHHDDRLRSSAASRRHARGDRLREGRHHQAGDDRGRRAAARRRRAR